MAEQLGDAILILRTDDAQYDSGITRARGKAEQLGQAMDRTTASSGRLEGALDQSGRSAASAGERFEQTGKQVTTSANAQRAGMQQLGYQLGDIATMYSLGARPAQIFGSQIGQVTQALQLMGGSPTSALGRVTAFLGGPWGIALTVATIALSPFIAKLFETETAANRAREALERMAEARRDAIADQMKFARAQEEVNRLRERENKLQAEFDRRKALTGTERGLASGVKPELDKARAERREAEAALEFESRRSGLLSRVGKRFSGVFDDREGGSRGGSGGGSRGGGGGSARIDPLAGSGDRFADEFGRLRAQLLAEEARYTGALRDLHEAELARIEEGLASYARQLANRNDLDAAQKDRLLAEREALAQQERWNAEQEHGRRIAQERAELAQGALDLEVMEAELASRLAESSSERLAAELALLDLHDRLRLAELDRILAVEATASAAWQNARDERDALLATRGTREELVRRQNEGPLARYLRSIPDTPGEISDRVEALVVDELEAVRRGISDAIASRLGIRDPLLSGLIELFIEQVLIRPIAEALERERQKGRSGGGGLLGKLAGAIFGGIGTSAGEAARLLPSASATVNAPEFAGFFAQGGLIPQGGWGIVGERGPERVIAGPGGATVVPGAGGGSGSGGVYFDLRGAVMTEDLLKQMNAISREHVGSAFASYNRQSGALVQDNLARHG
jgi:hypothetical protein